VWILVDWNRTDKTLCKNWASEKYKVINKKRIFLQYFNQNSESNQELS
jgi:hypothetical protein